MTAADVTSYRLIHRALRRAPHRLGAAVRHGDPADRRRTAAIARYWKGYAGEVLAHHTIEDDVFFPALVDRVPMAARLIERTDHEHHVLDELMARCGEAVRRLQDATATGPVLAEPFEALAEHMDRHLDFEDAEILPLFERHFDADEYEAMDQEALEQIGVGPQAAFTIPFAAAVMDPEELRRVIGTAPAPVRVIHRLTKGRHARLDARALGPVAAAQAVRS